MSDQALVEAIRAWLIKNDTNGDYDGELTLAEAAEILAEQTR